MMDLEGGLSVRIFSAPYFLATKLEAFVDRRENEGRFSTDFEDIVHVLNNRGSITAPLAPRVIAVNN